MRVITQKQVMRNSVASNLLWSSLIGFLLVLPFLILESLNQTISKENAPSLIALFGLLWLLPTAFIVILIPLLRAARAGHGLMANPYSLLSRVVLLVLISIAWGSIVIDQMPCFLGVPNCD